MKLVRNAFCLFCLILICFGLSSCDRNSEESSSSIQVPSFSVDPLEDVSLDAFSWGMQSSLEAQGAFPLSVESLTDESPDPEISSEARISCADEVEELNNAPKLDSREDLEYTDYLRSFYAITSFYDCNVRQQIQEDEVTRADSGQYTASRIGSTPADYTRFVSWIYRDNNAGESIAHGRLVNRYLQEDGMRTQTRIDLSYNGDKNVDSLVSFVSRNPDTNSEYRYYTRVFFQEVSNDEGDVVEHQIAGRHYNSTQNDVVVVAAVVKLGVGTTVFLKTCQDTNDLNFNCDISSDATVKHFSAAGIEMDEPPAGMPTSPQNVGRRYRISHFYDDQTESQYFNPSFTPPGT